MIPPVESFKLIGVRSKNRLKETDAKWREGRRHSNGSSLNLSGDLSGNSRESVEMILPPVTLSDG